MSNLMIITWRVVQIIEGFGDKRSDTAVDSAEVQQLRVQLHERDRQLEKLEVGVVWVWSGYGANDHCLQLHFRELLSKIVKQEIEKRSLFCQLGTTWWVRGLVIMNNISTHTHTHTGSQVPTVTQQRQDHYAAFFLGPATSSYVEEASPSILHSLTQHHHQVRRKLQDYSSVWTSLLFYRE